MHMVSLHNVIWSHYHYIVPVTIIIRIIFEFAHLESDLNETLFRLQRCQLRVKNVYSFTCSRKVLFVPL